jgi:hypothetical protein
VVCFSIPGIGFLLEDGESRDSSFAEALAGEKLISISA